MKYGFLFLLTLTLFSCSTNGLKEETAIHDGFVSDTIPPADEELYFEASGDGEPADTLPVKEILADRYPNLFRLVSKLETALLEHRENDVIDLCDPENYEEQKESGISKFQYIYEILNIEGREFKEDENYRKYCRKFINDIVTVDYTTFDGISGSSLNEYYIFGNLTTGSGEKAAFSITVLYRDGDYLITGAVG